jgi:DNA-binding NtrC family response regulator
MERSNPSVTRVVSKLGRDVRVIQTCDLEATLPSGERVRGRMAQPFFTIGSHESNDLVVLDPTVSKQHLEISATREGFRLADLTSSNGTYLDSCRIGALTIVEPVGLRLGDTALRVVPGGEEVELPASPEERFGTLVGRSAVMREMFVQLELIAKSDCSVLVEGETGTGKETIARNLHERSARRAGPFVVLECAGMHSTLLEDELFGHVRGAFTGADTETVGLLESASGGTLFLDDISDLPLMVQSKFLGALDRRKVTRLGSQTSRHIDIRIIAGSQKGLAREVNEGRFRADLFYRVAVARIHVPPLRERLEDLPLLCAEILQGARSRGLGTEALDALSTVALTRLRAQPWPGNVRELKNAMERTLLRLPAEVAADPPAVESAGHFFSDRARAVAEFERTYLRQKLAANDGNLSATARASGLDRSYLARILKRLGLSVRDV